MHRTDVDSRCMLGSVHAIGKALVVFFVVEY